VTRAVPPDTGSRGASSELLEATLREPDVHRQWEERFRTPANARFYDLVFDHLVRISGMSPEAVVLDAGCGIADYALRLAKHGMRVVAVDFSESVLAMARENVRRSSLSDRIMVRRENILSLSFEDESFDSVLCWGVLMHIPEVERAITELARVVRRGGVVIVSESNMFSCESLGVRLLKRVWRRNRDEVQATPAGLEHWEMTPAGTLVTRETNIGWLAQTFEQAGLTLQRRLPGQFTEFYTRVSSTRLQRLIHAFNHVWFKYVRFAPFAVGNILVLRRHV
jgi:ubiquinone/menaquinone biosynthesis C-methylase UbiE